MKETMALLTYILFLSFLTVTFGEDCPTNNVPEQIVWEKKLRKDLKCNLYIFSPPSGNFSDPLIVSVRFIMKYFKFSSNEEVFTVTSWMFISWTDIRLKWDPAKYNGINETEMSSTNIWTPSFRLKNSADSNDYDRFIFVRCRVKNTGEVHCVPKIVHEAMCSVNLKNWPYDVQECSLEIGAWTSKWNTFKMNFTKRAISMLGAEYGAEWFISDYKQEEGQEPDSQLKMTFVLEREAAGLAAIVLYPSAILTVLSITSLFLDVRYNTRLGFACFSVMSHYYFLTELAQDLPKESVEPPTILLCYRGSLILTVMILLFTFFLAAICKLKSTPPNYIITINNFVYDSYGKYFVFPRWDFDDIMTESKEFSHIWTKFANVVNSAFVFIILIAYISLYGSLMPKPAPVNY